MRINYVVCFYITDGAFRNNLYHHIDKFFAVKAHVEMINMLLIPTDIVKATFIVNRSDYIKDGDVEQIIEDHNKKHHRTVTPHTIPIEVKYRDNWGRSYGAWEYHIRQSLHENYDFYFLTEDDYIPNIRYQDFYNVSAEDRSFYKPFLEKFTDNTAFVCGLWSANHPAISYGLYSANICKTMFDRYGEIFRGYNQKLAASKIFEYDEWQRSYHLNFFDSGFMMSDTTKNTSTVYCNHTYGINGSPPLLPLV